MTPRRTPIDLHELCISYRYVGAMGLPRDIIEEISHFLHKDVRALKACSLTCRALFSAVRRLIHRRVSLATRKDHRPRKLVDRIVAKVFPSRGRRVHEANMRYLSAAGKRRLLGYAREVYIDIGQSLVPETLEAYLPHFRSLNRVQTLGINHFDLTKFLPTFERYFVQFVPTLRSLHLPQVMGDASEVLKFICNFPQLDDLSLTLHSSYHVEVPPGLSMEHSPPLKGTLVLRGSVSTPVRFLLEIPGGLHFRSIDANGVDKAELDEILVTCSSTLEEFSLRPRSRKFTQHHHAKPCRSLNHPLRYPALDIADLSGNSVLARFKLRVDLEDLTRIPSLLHKTLSTISSPAFSEFTLKLESSPTESRFFHLLSSKAVWGVGWGVIDRDLNKIARAIGRDIRLVVRVGMDGGVWSPEFRQFVRGMFPLMGARGLVEVEVVKPTFKVEGGQFIC